MIFALAAIVISMMLAGCMRVRIDDTKSPANVTVTPEPKEQPSAGSRTDIVEDGYYYDLESVVLYYDMFGKLPGNYITKNEAKSLGWEGGSVDDFKKGAAIGGDHFGNYEKRLPEGAKYIECDIDTRGKGRGAKRLIISNKGDYYYTSDHYESFDKVTITDGKVSY